MRIACASSALLLLACAGAQKPRAADDERARAQQIVDAADRTPEDRALDPGRKPVEMLVFLHLRPAMRVAELGAGGGYTTELMARAVRPNGVVYAQNPDIFIQRFLKTSWPARLARPAMKNVGRVDREFEDPFPPEAKNLDLVLINVIYHDVAYMNVDREKMNKTVFGTLLRRAPSLALRRERWELSDGDFLDVDRLEGAKEAPLLVVLHGLEGSSSSHYVRGLLAQAQRRGWRALAVNFRSCSGELNRLVRSYHSGETGDLAEAVLRARGESP